MSQNYDEYDSDEFLRTDLEYTDEEIAALRAEEAFETEEPAFRLSTRRMITGFSFSQATKDRLRPSAGDRCPKCKEKLTDSDWSIDHVESVSQYFNRTGYSVSKAARNVWYNDYCNLQAMHRRCNSSKGGVLYDQEKLNTYYRGKNWR